MDRILVTGSAGLIGSALSARLRVAGQEVAELDIAPRPGRRAADVTDYPAVLAAMRGCSGVIHLAAVSRVASGERDPGRCHAVNADGTRNVLEAASAQPAPRPWVIVASSREVYGQPARLPVTEAAPFAPRNAYARSKAAAELLAAASRDAGLAVSVIRFASVYGTADDHPDRVAPAFARLAAEGGVLRVDGPQTTLDFTHLDDVTAALQLAVAALAGGTLLPPLHLVSGRAMTLPELADIAIGAAGDGRVELAPALPYNVSTFVGDPERAARELGWRAVTTVEDGMARLVSCFQRAAATGRPVLPARPVASAAPAP